MSGTGIHYQDLVPVPEKTNAVSDPEKQEKGHIIDEGETASHVLATSRHDDSGVAQKKHDQVVKDLGWNEPQEKIPTPLVGGIDNEYLWMQVRRFNKQIYHVKEITTPVPGNLDLNIADEDEFSPDKLRSTVERLYMTVGIGLMSSGKHVMRLRSWREKRRTAAFCAFYFLTWALDLLLPAFASLIIVLIVFPPARYTLFPPAPLSLVSGKTGGVQKPPAGVLGSTDSATGAPEQYQGEAVEQEANNFVNGIAHVALSSATGKHPQGEQDSEEGAPGDSAPDPTSMAVSASDARSSASGANVSAHRDKTKQPMEAAMWNNMRPIMHGLQDLADGWERFANALSPTAPFPRDAPRLRLASLVVPLLAASLVVTSYMFMKGMTFGIGFGFFGDPVITRGLHLLNTHFPNFWKLLELRNTILKGVPTNAQLTITLLRVGEANKAPLPPPPRTPYEPPPDAPVEITDQHLDSTGADAPLGAIREELEGMWYLSETRTALSKLTIQQAEAASHNPSAGTRIASSDVAAAKDKTHGKKGSKVLNLLKSSVKGSVTTAIGADKVKAASGSAAAKNRLGVLPKPGTDQTSGPIEFKSRFHGKKGHTYIVTKATIPCVSFTTDSTVEKIGTQDREDLHPVWTIPVSDVKELKKVGGYGWKTRLVVGWAMNREVADGLEITTRKGEIWKITAMPLRDELFNRLLAMGGQKWEAW